MPDAHPLHSPPKVPLNSNPNPNFVSQIDPSQKSQASSQEVLNPPLEFPIIDSQTNPYKKTFSGDQVQQLEEYGCGKEHEHEEQEQDGEEEGITSPVLSSGTKMNYSKRSFGRKRKGKKGGIGQKYHDIAIQKKMQALSENFKPIPFVPDKVLDFSKHEESLKKLGLWDFALIEFGRDIRDDLIKLLIVNYVPKNRGSYVNDVKVKVSRADLARALKLPVKKLAGDLEGECFSADFLVFVEEFVSNWMLLHDSDMWVMPSEVVNWLNLIKEGQPQKLDWAGLIWFMMEQELAQGSNLEECWYASHFQLLIKDQKDELLNDTSEVVEEENEEVTEVGLGDSEGGDTKILDVEETFVGEVKSEERSIELSLGRDSEMALKGGKSEIAQKDVESEMVQKDVESEMVQKDGDSETVQNDEGSETSLKKGDSEIVLKEGDSEIALKEGGSESVLKEGDSETALKEGDSETVLKEGDSETALKEVDSEMALKGGDSETVQKDGDSDTVLKDCGPEMALKDGDSETAPKDGDSEMARKDGDSETALMDGAFEMAQKNCDSEMAEKYNDFEMVLKDGDSEMAQGSFEMAQKDGDYDTAQKDVDSERAQEDGDVERRDDAQLVEMNVWGRDEVKNEDSMVCLDDPKKVENIGIDEFAENSEGVYKVHMPDFGAQKQWLGNGSNDESQPFLKPCSMAGDKAFTDTAGPHVSDNDLKDEEDEDCGQAQGFKILPKSNLDVMSSVSLMQALETGQLPYTSTAFGGPSSLELMSTRAENDMMLDGSSLFNHAGKRGSDFEHDMSHHSLNQDHKRMRMDENWDKKPPDFAVCMEQLHQWMEKAKVSHETERDQVYQQANMMERAFSQQVDEKVDEILQLRCKVDELQRKRQAEVSLRDRELHLMNNVIHGYRMALKETQRTFAEYRKRFCVPDEPFYKDAGRSGVVKSIRELEKERLMKEEEERKMCHLLENAFNNCLNNFESRWQQGVVHSFDDFDERLEAAAMELNLLRAQVVNGNASENVVMSDDVQNGNFDSGDLQNDDYHVQSSDTQIKSDNSQIKDVQNDDSHIKDVQNDDSQTKDVHYDYSQITEIQNDDRHIKDVQNYDSQIKVVEDGDTQMKDVQNNDAQIKDVQNVDAQIKDVQNDDAQFENVQNVDAQNEDV